MRGGPVGRSQFFQDLFAPLFLEVLKDGRHIIGIELAENGCHCRVRQCLDSILAILVAQFDNDLGRQVLAEQRNGIGKIVSGELFQKVGSIRRMQTLQRAGKPALVIIPDGLADILLEGEIFLAHCLIG